MNYRGHANKGKNYHHVLHGSVVTHAVLDWLQIYLL